MCVCVRVRVYVCLCVCVCVCTICIYMLGAPEWSQRNDIEGTTTGKTFNYKTRYKQQCCALVEMIWGTYR